MMASSLMHPVPLPPGRLRRRTAPPGLCTCIGLLLLFSPVAGAEWVNNYPAARQLAQQRNQPLCLYFRVASSAASQNFETQVLAQPAVAAALSGFIAVYLDPTWNESLAEKYGIYRAPAIVLIDATEMVLYRDQGNMSPEALLEALTRYGVQYRPNPLEAPQSTPTPLQPVPVAPQENSGILTMPVPEAARLKPIPIRARSTEVQQLQLHYRIQGAKDYLSVPMKKQAGQDWWQGEIPGWIVTPQGVEYYISGRKENEQVTVPQEYNRKPFGIKVH